jgi:hypothetical protein
MTRRDDVQRLLVAVNGRSFRPSAMRELARSLFGPDAPKVVALALTRGVLVLDLRGLIRPAVTS